MKQEVMVSKAAFELRKGETVEMFLRQLRNELEEKYRVRGTRANDYHDSVYVWTKAVLPGRVIFNREGSGAKRQGIHGMYASDYTRDMNTTKFAFAEPVSVMEEKEFVPIQKSADFQKMYLPSFWDGAVPGV